MTQKHPVAPTQQDREKLQQLRQYILQEASQASAFMASVWEDLHRAVARGYLRAEKALARAERSAVLATARAARRGGSAPSPASAEQEE
ncbi:hypothetical protein [Thermogemmatispora sp.]|uniref:hypothetical protein n=1 Tax=Thermogemmatispora sp. TaxID=1968838 RepID=UPI0035E41B83